MEQTISGKKKGQSFSRVKNIIKSNENVEKEEYIKGPDSRERESSNSHFIIEFQKTNYFACDTQ